MEKKILAYISNDYANLIKMFPKLLLSSIPIVRKLHHEGKWLPNLATTQYRLGSM